MISAYDCPVVDLRENDDDDCDCDSKNRVRIIVKKAGTILEGISILSLLKLLQLISTFVADRFADLVVLSEK